MKTATALLVMAAFVCGCAAAPPPSSSAPPGPTRPPESRQPFKPNPTEIYKELTKELQFVDQSHNRLGVVIWLPTEFWIAEFEQSGKVTPTQLARLTGEFESYVVVAVLEGEMDKSLVATFKEPDALRDSVTIENARGELFSALQEDQVSGDVSKLTQMMRPALANMMGAMGSHLALLIFPGKTKDGLHTVEPSKEGTFTVHLGSTYARYRLPLAGLLPPAIDTKTGESFPGNYHYNPYSGEKLSNAQGR